MGWRRRRRKFEAEKKKRSDMTGMLGGFFFFLSRFKLIATLASIEEDEIRYKSVKPSVTATTVTMEFIEGRF